MNYCLIFLIGITKIAEVTAVPEAEDEVEHQITDNYLSISIEQNTSQPTINKLDEDLKINNDTRHDFFRAMDGVSTPGRASSRRVFGGAAKELKDFPAVCALLDRYWAVRCTATVVTVRWVLTAAHCVTSKLAYVKYNTRRPASNEGNVTAVHYLYRHPNFKVNQKDEGRGLDVVALHHDVGLVRTKSDIELVAPGPVLAALRRNNPTDLHNKDVQVLGFGRTERSVLGEELFSVDLRLVGCERNDWIHCVCGVSTGISPRAVCSGDSGGPVIYEGTPVGVTSMGPVECAHNSQTPATGATSVFTSLYQYADVINTTIVDTEAALRVRKLSPALLCTPCTVLLGAFFILLVR